MSDPKPSKRQLRRSLIWAWRAFYYLSEIIDLKCHVLIEQGSCVVNGQRISLKDNTLNVAYPTECVSCNNDACTIMH